MFDCSLTNWPLGIVVRGIGVEGLAFGSRTGVIGHSVAKGSPLRQRFCVVLALSRGDGPHHWLHASA